MELNTDYFDLFMQLRPSSCVYFYKYRGERRKNHGADRSNFTNTLRENPFITEEDIETYSYRFTAGAKKRLQCATDILLMIAKNQRIYNNVSKSYHDFKYSFITLTISDKTIHDYKTCNSMLEDFTKWLVRTKNVNMYVWKLELQERGQIHYHLLCDKFIHWRELRDKWNTIQHNRIGILKGMDYNSTDIHKVYEAKDISKYIGKYISKDAGDIHKLKSLGVKKMWGCSQNLQGKKRFTIEVDMRKPEFNYLANIGKLNNFQEIECSLYAQYCYLSGTTDENSLTKRILSNDYMDSLFIEYVNTIIPNYYTPD